MGNFSDSTGPTSPILRLAEDGGGQDTVVRAAGLAEEAMEPSVDWAVQTTCESGKKVSLIPSVGEKIPKIERLYLVGNLT